MRPAVPHAAADRRGHLAKQFHLQPDGHGAPVPNKTSSVSGR